MHRDHYFRTYKAMGEGGKTAQIYGREHALRVVAASIADYEDGFGD